MTDTPLKKERPLSPHLQIYKPQITSISSILHRLAGVALTMGLFIVTWGLIALADGRESFEFFTGFFASTIGQIILIAWTGAFFYHMCTGLRHFILDAGYLYEKCTAAMSGFIVIALAALKTGGVWAYVYRDMIFGGAI